MSNTQYNPEGLPWPPENNDPSYVPPPFYQARQQQGGYGYAQPQQQQAGYAPQQPLQQAGYGYAQPQPIYYQPVMVAANNDNSAVTLVLGILSIVFAGPIGLILGIVGLVLANKARRQFPVLSGTTTAGRVCAIIGIVFSSFALVFFVLYFLIFFFALIAGMHGGSY